MRSDQTRAAESGAGIIPAVIRWQGEPEALSLAGALTLIATSAVFNTVVKMARSYLSELGFQIGGDLTNAGDTSVSFIEEPSFEPEAYELSVSELGISISAATACGAFWGLQTLRQMLFQVRHLSGSNRALPMGKMFDAPRFPYRGMHLDVSRHFFSVDDVKRYIDLLALHKYNYFHWHLSDDAGWRIEINRYPKLTEIGAYRKGTVKGFSLNRGAESDGIAYGGYYSQLEVSEIVTYALERHVTVIPEIDVPGHSSAILAAYPEFGCSGATSEVKEFFGICQDVLCVKETTFEFLKDVFSELAQLFPGPYIHIGGDEVLPTRWAQCESCQLLMKQAQIAEASQLQRIFNKRVCDIVAQLGKQPIAWADVVESDVEPMTVMPWLGKAQAESAARSGHRLIMTPVEHAYFDFYQSQSLDEPLAIHPQVLKGVTTLHDVYVFDPYSYVDAPEIKTQVIGAQGNVWTEYNKTMADVELKVLPRMSALAEVLWTEKARQNWDDFLQRLPSLEALLSESGYRVSDAHLKPVISAEHSEDGFRVVLNSPCQMVYTLDGSRPSLDSARYEGPIVVSDCATVRAASIVNQMLIGDVRLTIENHLAIGQKIILSGNQDLQSPSALGQLNNGQLAHDRPYDCTHWTAFVGRDMDATIQFSRPTRVSSVRVGFDSAGHRVLHRPCALTVYNGDAQTDIPPLAQADRDQIIAAPGYCELVFQPVTVNRLRLVAHNGETIWSPSHGIDMPKTIHIDEIVVR